VIEHTGFDFARPEKASETPPPSLATLKLLREVVAPQLAEVYPQFAARVFGVDVPIMVDRDTSVSPAAR
jgi:glutaconate CoA-transferase, subunit B